jgi:hypothetical protein
MDLSGADFFREVSCWILPRGGRSFAGKKNAEPAARSWPSSALGTREPGEPLFPLVIVRVKGGFGLPAKKTIFMRFATVRRPSQNGTTSLRYT